MANLAALAAQASAAQAQERVGTSDAMVNLRDYVNANGASVSNNATSTNVKSVLEGSGFVKSDADVDQQLLFVIPFRERVKIRGIRITANTLRDDDNKDMSGPKTVHLFVDKPHLSFQDAESEPPTQTIVLTQKQLDDGIEVPLKYVKFQNISSITIFFPDNQDDSEITFVNKIEFVGAPIAGMNVSDIKKIDDGHDH